MRSDSNSDFSNADVPVSVIYSRSKRQVSYTSGIFSNITVVNSHLFTSDTGVFFNCYIVDITTVESTMCNSQYQYFFFDCVIPSKFVGETNVVMTNTVFSKPQLAFLNKWKCEAEIPLTYFKCSHDSSTQYIRATVLISACLKSESCKEK